MDEKIREITTLIQNNSKHIENAKATFGKSNDHLNRINSQSEDLREVVSLIMTQLDSSEANKVKKEVKKEVKKNITQEEYNFFFED